MSNLHNAEVEENSHPVCTTCTETSLLRQEKVNEASSFFWAIPIKPPYVIINATEYWAKQPSFNICVLYQHGHRFYNRECGKQEIHNSIKAGITPKLYSLMESYCLGTAQSRGLICAASRALQITIPSVHPPGSCAQQCSSGIHQQHRAASPAPGWLGSRAGTPAIPAGAALPGIPSPGHGGGAGGWAAPPEHQTAGNKEQELQRIVKVVIIQWENRNQIKPPIALLSTSKSASLAD